jgi:hypothetical protein
VCPRCLAVVEMTFRFNVEPLYLSFHQELLRSICIEDFSWESSDQNLSRVVSQSRRHRISIPPSKNKTTSLLISMVSDDDQAGTTTDHLSLGFKLRRCSI